MPMNAPAATGAALSLAVGLLAASAALLACETDDPTRIQVENAYPEVATGGALAQQMVVYKVWWEVTLFDEPLLPTAASSEERGAPQTATAYALVAPGWDPASGAAPTRLLPLKSKELLEARRGETLRIRVSDATFAGSCAARQPLSQEDASFITERIFPGDFAAVRFDAATCTTTPLPSSQEE
jgi:hypothetical protein